MSLTSYLTKKKFVKFNKDDESSNGGLSDIYAKTPNPVNYVYML